jgi:hypothetical protein
MATPKNTKLCDFTSTNNSDFICTRIAPPALAANFYEIKPALLNLVMKEQFSGATTDDAADKVVRIPIQILESYDFTTLQHHVDPNPTMNPNLIESMLSPDRNHRILYNIAKSQSCLWTLPILND